MEHTDVIVVGLGAFGAATAQHLAQKGQRVIGLDRYEPPHPFGSSHGRTRLIRHANSRHPDYVPLVLRARELWHSLEKATNTDLVEQTGLLIVGPESGYSVLGGLAADEQHGLGMEMLTGAELARRFPDVTTFPGEVGLYEPTGAVLSVEQSIEGFHAEAIRHGADLRTSCAVERWEADGDRVTVTTEQGTITADRLVLATGAWMADLWNGDVDAGPKPAFDVFRQHFAWFDAPARPDLPLLSIDRGQDPAMFVFPDTQGDGLKIGVDLVHGVDATHPDRVSRDVTPENIALLVEAAAERLRWAGATIREAHVCLYEMTSDWRFALGEHPVHDRVVIAGGGSMIGFMYAPAVGEAIADLIVGRKPPYEMAMFEPARLVTPANRR